MELNFSSHIAHNESLDALGELSSSVETGLAASGSFSGVAKDDGAAGAGEF